MAAFPHQGDLFGHVFGPCEGGAESICHVRRGIKGGDERQNNHLNMNREDKYLQESAAVEVFLRLVLCHIVLASLKVVRQKKPQKTKGNVGERRPVMQLDT